LANGISGPADRRHPMRRGFEEFYGFLGGEHSYMNVSHNDPQAGSVARRDETRLVGDNGGPTMPTTTINGSSNAPLRGSKRQTWEGGIRVAFAIAWKDHIAAGRVDDRPIIQLDVLPTALAAAGVAANASEFDGVNLLPFLTDQAQARRTTRSTGASTA
jgi:arylsulfatase A-like enzyme